MPPERHGHYICAQRLAAKAATGLDAQRLHFVLLMKWGMEIVSRHFIHTAKRIDMTARGVCGQWSEADWKNRGRHDLGLSERSFSEIKQGNILCHFQED